jgi:transposase InsO family protein
VPPDLRDTVVDFVRRFSARTELGARWVLARLGVVPTQFYRWTARYGRVNTHNGQIPRDHWLTVAERDAILAYHATHAPEGYRRMTFMMLDADVVAVSPATVYRVRTAAGVLDRWNGKPSKKGTGFVQPLRPHEHWHIDISYLNVAGTFYYLCSILDGATRFIVHWELRERMTEADVETVLQRAHEHFPEATPRIISDNVLPTLSRSDWGQGYRRRAWTRRSPDDRGRPRSLYDHPAVLPPRRTLPLTIINTASQQRCAAHSAVSANHALSILHTA